jgi:hypothetical protein
MKESRQSTRDGWLLKPSLLHTGIVKKYLAILQSPRDFVNISRVCKLLYKLSQEMCGEICSDLSMGLSKMPLVVVNDNAPIMFPAFHYCSWFVGSTLSESRLTAGLLAGCNCLDGICDARCSCLNRNPVAFQNLNDKTAHQLFECQGSCSCACDRLLNKSCSLRRSQSRFNLPLSVRRHALKGWSLECGVAISIGDAVCDYYGEFITSHEAKLRQSLRDRGLKQPLTHNEEPGNFILTIEEVFAASNTTVSMSIDAGRHGSAGRFVNHSCSPNLRVVCVRSHSFVPTLVFVATKDISPGEELTIDYGAGANNHVGAEDATMMSYDVKRVVCCCGADHCRGFLPFHI